MSDLRSSLTALISNILRRFLGADIDRPVFGPVAWSDLGAMACIILFMLLLHGTAAALVRHKTRQARAEAKELKDHFFGALGRPLYLLIWAYGIYLAASPMRLKLPANEQAAVRDLMDRLTTGHSPHSVAPQLPDSAQTVFSV